MGPELHVSLSKLKSNLGFYKQKVKEVEICAVVKANAYGFGLAEIGRYIQKDVRYLAVVRVEEAVQLRESGVETPILIIGYVASDEFSFIVDFDLTATVKSEDVAKTLASDARRKNKIAKVHIEIDSGLHRIGVSAENALFLIKKILGYPNLEVEGIYTHFSTYTDEATTSKQFETFNKILVELEKNAIQIPIRHASASYAALNYPVMRLDMVRIGGGLYGYNFAPELEFIGELKTKVTQVTRVKKGDYVGYNFGYQADRDMIVATIAIGYGDGFRRTPKNFDKVLIKGYYAPILGYVAMDQSMVDVSSVPQVGVGDEVTVIGKNGKNEIKVEDVARKLGTNDYEVITSISSRVNRIYNK